MLTHIYQTTRPYLYHLTDRANLAQIRKTNQLCPAASLMEAAGRHDLLRQRRRGHERIIVGKTAILIRDQAPLHKGNISFEDGYTFDSFVESLNRRVFFWPGTASGPISYGIRHFARYQGERPIVLRLGCNRSSDQILRLSRFTVDTTQVRPDVRMGIRVPGVKQFAAAADFAGTPSTVVEVTFREPITLPRMQNTPVDRRDRGARCWWPQNGNNTRGATRTACQAVAQFASISQGRAIPSRSLLRRFGVHHRFIAHWIVTG